MSIFKLFTFYFLLHFQDRIEGSYGASQNFYQTIFTAGIALLTRKPILKRGGTIILYVQCKEGIGSKIFQDLLSSSTVHPEQILFSLKHSPLRIDQWSLQHFVYFLTQCHIYLVSTGITPDEASKMGMTPFNFLQEAFQSAKNSYGKDLKVLVVKSPDFLVPVVK